MPDVKRLFGYHGAEHKTINAYEAGAELTPKMSQNFLGNIPVVAQPSCSILVLVSILVFTALGRFRFFGGLPAGFC